MRRLNCFISQLTLQRVLACLVLIPLLAYSFAPFQDMTLPFLLRLVFWAGVTGLAIAVTQISSRFVQDRFSHLADFRRDVAYAILILCLFAPALWLMTWLVFAFNGQSAPGPVTMMPYGAILATGLMLVRPGEPETERSDQLLPRLYHRLPAGFDGQIYRLTVRDHYVDVVTSAGLFTIRSRFTDAIDEMNPIPGHCTHRSHWVTDGAIVGVEKQGGKTFMKLINGDLVPVSRKYRPQLEEDGLFCLPGHRE